MTRSIIANLIKCRHFDRSGEIFELGLSYSLKISPLVTLPAKRLAGCRKDGFLSESYYRLTKFKFTKHNIKLRKSILFRTSFSASADSYRFAIVMRYAYDGAVKIPAFAGKTYVVNE